MTNPDQIFAYLQDNCSGRSQAQKAHVVARHFGITVRDLNDAIRSLRKRGVMIGSLKVKPYGYYVPQTIEEARESLRCFKAELFDMLETYNKLKKSTLMHNAQQMALFQ